MASPAEIIDRICTVAKLDRSLNFYDVSAAIQEDNSGASYVDETTDANDAGADDVNIPDPFDTDDALYIGYSTATKYSSVHINVSTAGAGDDVSGETVWEYYNGATWETLPVSDGTNGLTSSGDGDVYFHPPSDWSTTTVNSQGPFLYVRFRALADDVYNTTQPSIRRISVHAPSEERRLALSFLQEAADKVCMDAQIDVPAEASVTLTADQAAYTLNTSPFPTDMLQILTMTITDNAQTRAPVTQVSWADMNDLRTGSSASATPINYAVNGQVLVFHPAPDSAATINLTYSSDAPTLVDDYEPISFLRKAHQWETLYEWAMYRAMKYKKQSKDAPDHYGAYQQGLKSLRRWQAQQGGTNLPGQSPRSIVFSDPSQDTGW